MSFVFWGKWRARITFVRKNKEKGNSRDSAAQVLQISVSHPRSSGLTNSARLLWTCASEYSALQHLLTGLMHHLRAHVHTTFNILKIETQSKSCVFLYVHFSLAQMS